MHVCKFICIFVYVNMYLNKFIYFYVFMFYELNCIYISCLFVASFITVVEN